MIAAVLLALTVAVTFDDLPATAGERAGSTDVRPIDRRIVESLARRKVPAVGFVNEIGLEIDGRVDPDRVAALSLWLDAGLELGNHTYSHPSAHKVPLDAYDDDILKGERVIRPLVESKGGRLVWFRHPFLQTGRDLDTKRSIETFLAAHGYRIAPVTIDNGEWIFAKAYFVNSRNRAMRKKIADEYVAYMNRKTDYWERSARSLFGRDIPEILLVHANQLNADTFPRILSMLEQRGYRFITLDDALKDPAYSSPDTFTGAGGISWIHRWTLTARGRSAILPDEPAVPDWIMREAGVDSE